MYNDHCFNYTWIKTYEHLLLLLCFLSCQFKKEVKTDNMIIQNSKKRLIKSLTQRQKYYCRNGCTQRELLLLVLKTVKLCSLILEP